METWFYPNIGFDQFGLLPVFWFPFIHPPSAGLHFPPSVSSLLRLPLTDVILHLLCRLDSKNTRKFATETISWTLWWFRRVTPLFCWNLTRGGNQRRCRRHRTATLKHLWSEWRHCRRRRGRSLSDRSVFRKIWLKNTSTCWAEL